jgi:hypothetical protein
MLRPPYLVDLEPLDGAWVFLDDLVHLEGVGLKVRTHHFGGTSSIVWSGKRADSHSDLL